MNEDVNFLFPLNTKEETLEKITKIVKYAFNFSSETVFGAVSPLFTAQPLI